MIGSIRISTAALQANAAALAQMIAPAKASFVVKSNAYGHGIVATARAVAPFAAKLCVYSIDEALVLRRAGLDGEIFVMGPVPEVALDEALAQTIELALWDEGTYVRTLAAACTRAQKAARVHVKIDTGVSRLGLPAARAAHAIETYASMAELRVAGIFSHLAAAEELDSPFTAQQLERFQSVTSATARIFAGERPLHHIAASAAAMLWPQTRLDMGRIGIALYGLWPSAQTRAAMNGKAPELQPALSIVSSLVAVRDVDAGTPIGYGCTYHAPKATRIGVVPLGYADGIPRSLSNRGAFIAGGKLCPIVGRICMNMTMIDLGHASGAQPGDRVTLLGTDAGHTVSADDWAAWSETINYEIVSRLPSELPRVVEANV